MSEPRALVKNAADPKQVKNAEDALRLDQDQQDNDWREIIHMPSGAGKRIIQYLLAQAGVSRSVWSPSAAIHRDAGRQEMGHLVLRRIVECDPKAGAEILLESYVRELEGEKRNG